jgi:hypothetical protein
MVYTPAGDTNINPFGAVPIFDGESPCTFTARVIATVSGGQFVMISGTLGTVFGSGAAQYAVNDITVAPALLYDNVGGLALYNQASGTNNYVTIARKGCFLVQSTDVVSGGNPVVFSSGGVVNVDSAAVSGTAAAGVRAHTIGRSLSAGDSGGYALVALNL